MPVIKVASAAQGPYVAAAVMSVTLAKASEPLRTNEQRKRVRAEKTRPRNPNRLTISQHVFPSKSIERFTDRRGRVSVYQLHRAKVILAKPNNPIFCAHRAWDEGTEVYMKRIEDAFQRIVAPIVDGKVETLAPEFKATIDIKYALWYTRTRYRDLEEHEVQLNGIAGNDLSKEQEENLEKNNYMFTRNNGNMPARLINGAQLQIRIGQQAHSFATSVTGWGVIRTQSGEFIVPDVPSHGIIPLTPRLALVNNAPDGMITEQNLAEINRAMRETSEDYFFARDCLSCPF
jgi:hypothetical protein